MVTKSRKIWAIKARNARKTTATEMRYMRRRTGYTRTDYKTNTQIAKALKKHKFKIDYWNTRKTVYNM
jgi:hypothetical protein